MLSSAACKLSSRLVLQVVLGSAPGSDGAFDQVNDFSASINEGSWSVPLATLINETSDVAYIVPAARSKTQAVLLLVRLLGVYAQLPAGSCACLI